MRANQLPPSAEDYDRLKRIEQHATKAIKLSKLPARTIRAIKAAKLSHLPPDWRIAVADQPKK
jgi:hypothetical protein